MTEGFAEITFPEDLEIGESDRDMIQSFAQAHLNEIEDIASQSREGDLGRVLADVIMITIRLNEYLDAQDEEAARNLLDSVKPGTTDGFTRKVLWIFIRSMQAAAQIFVSTHEEEKQLVQRHCLEQIALDNLPDPELN